MQVRLTVHDFEGTLNRQGTSDIYDDTLGIAAINFVGNRFKLNEDGLVPRLEETIGTRYPRR